MYQITRVMDPVLCVFMAMNRTGNELLRQFKQLPVELVTVIVQYAYPRKSYQRIMPVGSKVVARLRDAA